jgi:hypothetical protein
VNEVDTPVDHGAAPRAALNATQPEGSGPFPRRPRRAAHPTESASPPTYPRANPPLRCLRRPHVPRNGDP